MQAFRDAKARLERLGARVVGVSRDGLKSHERFREKEGLDFPLLSDPGKAMHEAFGVLVEKTMYGKPVTGVDRSTFLLDETGKVRRIWRSVKVDGHVEEVLAAIEEIEGPGRS